VDPHTPALELDRPVDRRPDVVLTITRIDHEAAAQPAAGVVDEPLVDRLLTREELMLRARRRRPSPMR
jgi:hypothetical protein